MKIVICIGSSCHLKGSRAVVEKLQDFVNQNNLIDKIELEGSFCMGKCQQGVAVLVDGEFYSLSPQTVDDFCQNVVLKKIK